MGLLKDGGEEALAQLMESYNPTSAFPLDVPALELDFNQFELDETGSSPETKSGPEEESGEPAIAAEPAGSATPPAPAETRAVEMEVKILSHRPEPPEREDEIGIPNVGTFRRGSGQPVCLRAYPYIKPEPVPVPRKRPQAYQGQDHYNPVWTYVRGTRRDRLRALVKQWNDAGSPTEDDRPTSEFEIRLYREERRIIQESQPWIGEISLGVDYNRLEECDRLVMNAIKGSDLLPQLEGGFKVATPSYLTVVLPGDKAMLTAWEAIEIGAAFPYARGCRQMPLGERIIVNDLYGTPLYQPADKSFELERSWGALAAADVIEATEADPNFVSDRAVRDSTGPRSYPRWPRFGPGPICMPRGGLSCLRNRQVWVHHRRRVD